MLRYFLLFGFCLFLSMPCLHAQVVTSSNLASKSVENVALAREKEAQGDKRQASYYLNEAATLEWERKNYPAAIEFFSKSLTLNEQVGNNNGINGLYNNLAMIYHDMENYNKALEFFLKNLAGRRQGTDKVSIISSLINISVVLNNLNRHAEAIKYLDESLTLAREMGDAQQMRSCYGMLAETYEKLGDSKNMLKYFDLYRTFHEKAQGDREKAHKSEMEHAHLLANNLELEKRNQELELERKEFELKKKDETIVHQSQKQLQLLHSLDKNQLIIRYLQKDSILKANAVELKNLQIKEGQERHDAQKKQNKIIQTSLGVGIALLLFIMGIFYMRYREKKKTNRQLALQKEEIQQTNEELQTTLELVEIERGKSDALLFSILPAETANELKNTGHATPRSYDKVTVLFTDFQGFTQIAGKMRPNELIEELNFCFSGFDEICKEYGLEKIKTIGDAYMCAGGVPIANDSNPVDAVKAAMAMVDWMKNWATMKEIKQEPSWHIRIGIHTGSVIAGVIGSQKFAYDIWGDAVNIASRMESAGEIERINISETTYEYVKDVFQCAPRGKIYAKGKGEVEMYFVEGLKE